jgi:urease accessory protein
LLHLTGVAVGLLARWRAGRIAVRTAGGAIALAGVAFLSGLG